jgi:hypothetical protein
MRAPLSICIQPRILITIRVKTMIAPSILVFALIQAGLLQQPVQPRSNFGVYPFAKAEPRKLTPREDAAVKKLQRKANDANVRTTITIVDVKWVGTKLAVRVLKKLFRDRPGFALVAIPELEQVIFRADAETKDEIKQILNLLSVSGSKGKSGILPTVPTKP